MHTRRIHCHKVIDIIDSLYYCPNNKSPFSSNSRRLFSNTSCQNTRASSGSILKSKNKQKAPPSMKAMQTKQMNEALRSGAAMDTIGILPSTFVPQPFFSRPNPFSNFHDRYLWEKARLKSRGPQIVQLLSFKLFLCRTKSKYDVQYMTRWEKIKYRLWGQYISLDFFKINKIAKELYTGMNKALARGYLGSEMEKKMLGDLRGNMKSRIEGRKSKEEEHITREWKMDRCWSTIVDANLSVLKLGTEADQQTMMQQFVVRLDTIQSLKIYEKNDNSKEDGKITKRNVNEYVVLQRGMIDGSLGEWKLWGVLKPNDMTSVKQDWLKDQRIKNGGLIE